MKTITIDGVKHHFKWNPSEKYLADYRSAMNAQKKPLHNPADEYKKWWELKNRKVFTGKILRTSRDYNNYVGQGTIELTQ